MFQDELEMFADVCVAGETCELSAASGNVALAVVYAALRSIDENGRSVKLKDIIDQAHANIAAQQADSR
jgi:hypothetical protein